MNYVTEHSLRASKGRMCYAKYGEMKEFAEKMMKMDVYIPTDPLETSFLNIDSVAKAELLKVRSCKSLKLHLMKMKNSVLERIVESWKYFPKEMMSLLQHCILKSLVLASTFHCILANAHIVFGVYMLQPSCSPIFPICCIIILQIFSWSR